MFLKPVLILITILLLQKDAAVAQTTTNDSTWHLPHYRHSWMTNAGVTLVVCGGAVTGLVIARTAQTSPANGPAQNQNFAPADFLFPPFGAIGLGVCFYIAGKSLERAWNPRHLTMVGNGNEVGVAYRF